MVYKWNLTPVAIPVTLFRLLFYPLYNGCPGGPSSWHGEVSSDKRHGWGCQLWPGRKETGDKVSLMIKSVQLSMVPLC